MQSVGPFYSSCEQLQQQEQCLLIRLSVIFSLERYIISIHILFPIVSEGVSLVRHHCALIFELMYRKVDLEHFLIAVNVVYLSFIFISQHNYCQGRKLCYILNIS